LPVLPDDSFRQKSEKIAIRIQRWQLPDGHDSTRNPGRHDATAEQRHISDKLLPGQAKIYGALYVGARAFLIFYVLVQPF
jgi:hypothetical protein